MKRFTRKFHIAESVFAILMIFIFSFLIWKSWNKNDIEKAKADLFPPSAPLTEFNNIRGWAWSENIGWVSFSCHDTPDACATNNYGAHALTTSDLSDSSFNSGYDEGALVGHAWSESLGWISFKRSEVAPNGSTDFPNSDDPYPSKNYTAKVNTDGTVQGWARALSGIGETTWDGWIKFSGTAQDLNPYGVKFASGVFSDYAWGGEMIGWLKFSGPGYQTSIDPPVSISLPTVSNLNADFADVCVDNKNPRFSFAYNSPGGNGVSLQKIDIEIIKQGGDFASPFKTIVDSSRTDAPGSNVSIVYIGNDLDRNFNYDWRLKVTDAFGFDSGWIEEAGSPDFYVEPNKRPAVNFSWTPKLLVPDTNIYFTGATTTVDIADATCYTGDIARECMGSETFLWTIQDATPATSILANPTVQFTSSGDAGLGTGKLVKLEVTDPDAGTCNVLKTITVSKPIPEFEEKRP